MARLLMIVSSARSINLASDKGHTTGYWADEVLKPYDKFVPAGVEGWLPPQMEHLHMPIHSDSSPGSTTLTKTRISFPKSCAALHPTWMTSW